MTQGTLFQLNPSTWEVRDFEGFHQSREITSTGHKLPWRFYVSGFGDTDCRVMMADGTYTIVPIDAKNRITINAQKFGPRTWDH
jgi:hypothetical protein